MREDLGSLPDERAVDHEIKTEVKETRGRFDQVLAVYRLAGTETACDEYITLQGLARSSLHAFRNYVGNTDDLRLVEYIQDHVSLLVRLEKEGLRPGRTVGAIKLWFARLKPNASALRNYEPAPLSDTAMRESFHVRDLLGSKKR